VPGAGLVSLVLRPGVPGPAYPGPAARPLQVGYSRSESADTALSCGTVEATAQAGIRDHVLVVRVDGACQHWAQMDVEIPGGWW
jgi:hypothetical protein